MNTIQIDCFISAAETLNFTKTAKNLYISQPTVTHHIAALESELGYQLFERINKKISLTPAGKKLYKSMKSISVDFNNAVVSAKKYGDGFRQELVIGCGSSEFEEVFLPEIIRAFKTQHKDVYVSFNMEPIREKMVALQEEKIDILFSTTGMVNDTSRFDYISLVRYPMVCVMNKENRLAGKNCITMDDIAGQNLILLDHAFAPPEMDALQKQLEKKYQSNILQYVSNVRLGHLIILCNMGIAIMPEFKYQKNEALVQRPFAWYEDIAYGISLKKNEDREYVKDFAKMTEKYFKQSSYGRGASMCASNASQVVLRQ